MTASATAADSAKLCLFSAAQKIPTIPGLIVTGGRVFAGKQTLHTSVEGSERALISARAAAKLTIQMVVRLLSREME
jgi:hypothetical protein